MSTLRVVYPVRPAKPVPYDLAQKVDDLFELRALLRQSQAGERALTAEILQGLTSAGLERFQGEEAVAIVGQRVTLAPDPQLFLEALGPRAWEALGADDLAAISESTTSPVLRVEAVEVRP